MRFELNSKHLLWTLFLIASFAVAAFAQEADSHFPGQPAKNDEDQPVGIKEQREKMRIDQEKKEYSEMVDRSQQALKLSQDIQKAFEQQPSLTRADQEKLDELEKLVKKVRSELGGGNSDDNDDEDQPQDTSPKTVAEAAKALSTYTAKLVDELKKTSRFSISVVAIQSSNSALKIVRFLKVSK
jgi:hypothetical protein